MANENETVADICREMKTYKNAEAFVECDDGSLDFVSVTDDLPKRIEAAHQREMDFLRIGNRQVYDKYCESLKTIEMLSKAITPVLECDESSMVCFKDAVHAAKRIAQKDLPCQRAEPCPCIPDGICEGCEKEKCIKGGK